MTADVDPAEEQVAGDRVLKRVLVAGRGELPGPGCRVRVHYVGTLMDGTQFDSSRDRGVPFEFTLGKGKVIKAWDIGVATMRIGEVCVLTCAPEFAYGANGSPPKILPDSWLKFEIEMLEWDGEDLSPKKNKGIVRYTVTPGNEYDRPAEGALINIEIVGKLHDVEGAEPFDKRSLSFYLGEGSEYGLCEGVEKALEKFTMGETSRLVIQPQYAFKSEGNKEFNVPADAVIEYVVTLKSFEKSDDKSYDYDYIMKQGKIFKEKGTEYFKAAKYQLAIKMYKNAANHLTKEEDLEGETDPELRKNILVSAHLNLALCYLKLNPIQAFDARDSANNALKIEPNNVKGLFRKGQALQALDESNEAIEAFEKVIDNEPENKAAANQITICKLAIKKQKEKEKKLYANMFEKFAEKDRETEKLSAKLEPDVMCETLGEWGTGTGEWADTDRDRAPTDFEKENPNILMLDKEGTFVNM